VDEDLGIAWLVKRLVVSKILRSKPAPDVTDVDGVLIEANTAGRMVWSSMVPAIVKRLVGSGDLENEMAEEYAHRLGSDLDNVSTKALKQGYNASLGKGIDKSLSWARVAEAWGLDGAQMRAFIGTMPKTDYSGDIIPPRSKMQLETMINTRADRIRDNETYAMNQLAQQVHWIKMRETGEVGPDITKQWHTALDERTCPICAPIDRKIVRVDKGFARGVFAPPVHPNCRCWVELLEESTVVTKRDYKRDSDGQFARVNSLAMTNPVSHPFGRDTFGNPRPTRDQIATMRKQTAPLKGGKGGYDIVGNPRGAEGVQGFGDGFGLVPTRDEKYYQMHYRDWYDKKTPHTLFSPNEYYARTWSMGTPYKQPTEEEVFSEEERAQRAQAFKDIEGRWAENVALANKEGRAPDMPSAEDLRTYWHWDPAWAGEQGSWEGKYREFHPSDKAPPVSEHRMFNELQHWQNTIDEKNKTLPPYEGLRSDGRKISYTPLPREYDDEFGLHPQNYPLKNIKEDEPAFKEYADDFSTRAGMMSAYRDDPNLVDLMDRENRARKGTEAYRASQKTKTLADVYNSGTERNSKRLPINPKKYTQGYKLKRLRADIQSRDSEIRRVVADVSKGYGHSSQFYGSGVQYKRDEDGQFARINTLVSDGHPPKKPPSVLLMDSADSTGDNIKLHLAAQRITDRTNTSMQAEPISRTVGTMQRVDDRVKLIPIGQPLLSRSDIRDIERVVAGKSVMSTEQVTLSQMINDYQDKNPDRALRMTYPKVQVANTAILSKAEEVSQIIYDSKTRSGNQPSAKILPRYVNIDIDGRTESVAVKPIISPTPVMVYVSAKDGIIPTQRIDFSKEVSFAFDPKTHDPSKYGDVGQVAVLITDATIHPSVKKVTSPLGVTEVKVDPSSGGLTGEYTVTTTTPLDDPHDESKSTVGGTALPAWDSLDVSECCPSAQGTSAR
jgi:hypothetical protein